MDCQLRNTAAFVLAVLAAGAATGQDVRTDVKDAAITARIETIFLFNEHLNPFNINTTTSNGVVTLTGSVREDFQKQLAEELARPVDGVTDVVNHIVVAPNATVTREKRNFRQKLEDQTITASVQSRLLFHRKFRALKISIVTLNGHVTLSGVVGTEEQKREIGEIAYETRGVESVTNNLVVRPKDELDQVQNVGRQLSDEWVEKRVETAITLNRHLSIRQVQVEVDDGVCILTGTVDSEAEKTVAGSIAEGIQGVREVRNEIRVREVPARVLEPIEAAPEPVEVPPAPNVSSTPISPP